MLSDTIIADALSKRSAWRVLAVMLQPPFAPRQQSEIARELGVPDATVQRGLRALMSAGLVQRKRRQYAINAGNDAVKYLWLLRQADRQRSLPSDLLNRLTLHISRDFEEDDCVILFGSWARGIAVPAESDVDLAVFTEAPKARRNHRLFEEAYRLELQVFSMDELRSPATSAALDALLNGIVFKRRELVFDVLTRLNSFPKPFLLYRLAQARQFLARAQTLGQTGQPDAASFFEELALRAVAQVRSIVEHGRTVSWREAPPERDLSRGIVELENSLAREGDQVWLT